MIYNLRKTSLVNLILLGAKLVDALESSDLLTQNKEKNCVTMVLAEKSVLKMFHACKKIASTFQKII